MFVAVAGIIGDYASIMSANRVNGNNDIRDRSIACGNLRYTVYDSLTANIIANVGCLNVDSSDSDV